MLSQEPESVFDLGNEDFPILAGGIEILTRNQRRGVETGTGLGERGFPGGFSSVGKDRFDLTAIPDEDDELIGGCGGWDESPCVLAQPDPMASRDITGPSESDAVKSGFAAVGSPVRDNRDIADDDRGGDGGPIGFGLRVEVAAGPQRAAIVGVMKGEVLGAPDQNGLMALVGNDQRRGVGVIAFRGGLKIASDFPSEMAGGLVESRQPGLALVHAGHDDCGIRQHGRGAVIPVESVLAVGFDEVGLPADGTVGFQGGEGTAFEMDVDAGVVRGRGRIGSGAVAMFAGSFGTQRGLPEHIAVRLKREHRVTAGDGGGQVNSRVPNDRGGAAFAGEWGFPGCPFRMELGWVDSRGLMTTVLITPPSAPF